MRRETIKKPEASEHDKLYTVCKTYLNSACCPFSAANPLRSIMHG